MLPEHWTKYEIICMTGTGDIGRRRVEWRRNANTFYCDY